MTKPRFTIEFLKSDNLEIPNYPKIITCHYTKVSIPQYLYDLNSEGIWYLDCVVDNTKPKSRVLYGDIIPSDGMVYSAYYWLANPCSEAPPSKGCVMVNAYDLTNHLYLHEIDCCDYFQENPRPKVPRDSTEFGYVVITFKKNLKVKGGLRSGVLLELQQVNYDKGNATPEPEGVNKYRINKGITCAFTAYYT